MKANGVMLPTVGVVGTLESEAGGFWVHGHSRLSY